MNLIRDVLDQQIIDAKDHKGGKVDGVALEIRPDGPPRIAYLETGVHALARRLSRRLERIADRWAEPTRLPWSAVKSVEISIRLEVEMTDYSDFRPENWLREHIIARIPGNAHHKHQEKKD
jgi:hypothetical protein